MKDFCLIYVGITLSLIGISTLCAAEEPGRTFVFRFDDYPTSDLDVQKSVIARFRAKGIPLTVAAVPADLKDDPEATEFLAESAGPKCEVALHGWDHSDRLNGSVASEMSEFVGLSADEQCERIRQGISVFKEHLGIVPATFVPPFNTYDAGTVKALREAGIRFVSADIARRDVDHGDLVCVPETCLLRDVAGSEDLGDGLYVVMFHGYDFVETGSSAAPFSLEDLDAILTRLAAKPATEFFSISSIAETGLYDFSADRLEAAQALVSYPGTKLFGFPAHWVRRMPATYETAEVYEQLLHRTQRTGMSLDLAAALGVLAMFASCYAVSVWAQRTAPRVTRTVWICAAAGVAGVLVLGNIHGVLWGSPGFGYKDRVMATVLAVLILVWIVRLRQVSGTEDREL